MPFNTRHWPRFLVLILAIGHFPFVRLAAADESGSRDTSNAAPLLDRIREKWRGRSQSVSAVRYVLKGTVTQSAGFIVLPGEQIPGVTVPPTGFPVEDTAIPLEIDWLIDWQGGRFRKSSRSASFNIQKQVFRPFVRKEYFDGESLKGHWPRAENTSPVYTPEPEREDVVYWRDKDLHAIVGLKDFPIFFAHGLEACRPGNLLAAGLADRASLHVAGELVIEGIECVILRDVPENAGLGSMMTTYYVAPAQDGAIIRIEMGRVGAIRDVAEIAWQPLHGTWLPKRWTTTHFTGDSDPATNELISTCELEVTQLEIDPAIKADDFSVPLEPGMIVLRREDDKKLRVAADGVTLEPLRPIVPTDIAPASQPLPWKLIGINATVLAMVVIWWTWSKRRGRRNVNSEEK